MMMNEEMIVVAIPSPETLRGMVEERRKLSEQRMAEWQAEQERQTKLAVVELVDYLMKKLTNTDPIFWWDLTVYPCDMKSNTSAIERACPIVESMLASAGYEVSFYEYSSSWYKQSGKFGRFSIKFKN